MNYIILAIFIIVLMAVNYAFMICAACVALKAYTKTLAKIIDLCADEDMDKIFMDKWRAKHR